MTIKIAIIGLGQIGASIGMGLKNHAEDLVRVGCDRESRVARQAKEKGALDKLVGNPAQAVKDADLVVLAVPINELEETLKIVAPMLKDQAVVLDTSPVRAAPFQWAAGLIPSGRHFAGFTPLISPRYLHQVEGGVEQAHEDLFEDGLIAITTSTGTHPSAIKMASDLAGLLKATPLFADQAEVDGLMAAVHVMPQLIAAALANTTTSSQGWREARKFTGRPYMLLTSLIESQDQPSALAIAAVTNKDNTVRVIDELIAELGAIRDEIQAEKLDAVEKRLGKARQARQKWWQDRKKGDWEGSSRAKSDLSTSGLSLFGDLLGKRRAPGREEDEKN